MQVFLQDSRNNLSHNKWCSPFKKRSNYYWVLISTGWEIVKMDNDYILKTLDDSVINRDTVQKYCYIPEPDNE